MTDQPAGSKMSDSAVLPDPRAQRMAIQSMINKVVRGMLRTPLLSRAAGGRLVTLYFTGRKSGRQYTLPVAYQPYEGDLLIGTPFKWGRNLRTGETIKVRLKGRLRDADVRAYSDEADVVRLYEVICRGNHTFASLNKVGLDADGNPNREDLHLAWLAGARAFRLTPR